MKHIAICLAALLLLSCQSGMKQGTNLQVATFDHMDRLVRPDVTEWVFMGANLGLGYAEGEFRSDRPGTFQLVYMEPQAYRYFSEFGEYADGTQFALTFWSIQEKVEPELNGFGQGEPVSFEIHLLDRRAFAEHRAFYLFSEGETSAAMVPPGNECVECHNAHGAYDGTFTQFYPPLRHRQDSAL